MYQNILVALDLSEDSLKIAQKAQTITNKFNAKLSLVHVIEPIVISHGIEVPVNLANIETHIEEQTADRLKYICDEIPIPENQCYQAYGRTANEVRRIAMEKNIDLIIVGTHGRHGISLLMGSTANDILHGAKCDILAVKIP